MSRTNQDPVNRNLDEEKGTLLRDSYAAQIALDVHLVLDMAP